METWWTNANNDTESQYIDKMLQISDGAIQLQASGVSVADDCQQAFDEIKLGHRHRFVIFSLNASQDTIIVEKKVTKDAIDAAMTPQQRYANFLEILGKKQEQGNCCYAIYDAEYIRANGQQRSKIIFIVW